LRAARTDERLALVSFAAAFALDLVDELAS
jgi:hypothetical protein